MKHIILFILPVLLLFGYSCEQPQPVDIIDSPAGNTSKLPYLTKDDADNLYLSWVEDLPDSSGTILKYARIADDGTRPNPIASRNEWFVNWADFPSIVVSEDELMAAHWLHKTPGNRYSYEIKLAIGNADNRTVLTPHDDATATEHGFVSMVPLGDQGLLAIWLDGRQTDDRAEDEYSDISKAMTLRSAVVGTDGEVIRKRLIDDSVCDCCPTSLARTDDGAIAAYRNRTEEEIRDIYVSRYRQGQWSEPILVHRDQWKIGGCPVNGPVVKASGDTVFVAWFTGADERNQVKASYSFDGGSTFQAPIRLDDGNPIGRVDASIVAPGKVAVSWMEKAGNEADLKIRIADAGSNTAGSSTTISKMAPDRKAGFPQLEVHNNRLFLAWTMPGEHTQVKMASILLEKVL